MIWLRSLLFSAGMLVTLVLYATVVLLLAWSPLEWRFQIASHWGRLMVNWLRLTCGVDYQISGLEHLHGGAVVILAKHQSTWETLALQGFARRPVWVAKRELLHLPFFGWALRCVRVIAIDRGAGKASVRSIVDQGRDRLSSGCSVVIFPEGTRVAPGDHRRYRMGGAVLAIETGFSVVPVAHNAGLFWGRRRFAKSSGTVQMRIGEPISASGKTAEELIEEVETWIESTVDTLSPPVAPQAAD